MHSAAVFHFEVLANEIIKVVTPAANLLKLVLLKLIN
jgi:hypothetical protein